MKCFFAALLVISVLSGCTGMGKNRESLSGSVEERRDGGADFISLVMSSYSAKNFTQREVSESDIELILQSGAKAPSARNMQPWHFTVVTNTEISSGFMKDAVEGCVYIVVSGLSEEIEGVNVDFDCALAVQNMYMAAYSLGLGAHIYGSPVNAINQNEKENLQIPEGYDAVTVLCIGYVENPQDAVTSASERNLLSEMVNYIQ